MAYEVRLKFHVFGGIAVAAGVTLAECMEHCFVDDGCDGLDYDMYKGACYFFTTDTVCGPLNPKDNCTHISKLRCCKLYLGW